MSVDLSPGRISPKIALKAVAEVAERWGIPKGQRYLLLGIPQSTADKWFAAVARDEFPDDKNVGRDVIERASHVASIYNTLHRLIGGVTSEGPAADVFFCRPSKGLQGGLSLRDMVLSGRFEDLIEVRHFVDRLASR